jgi:adenine-specific DNA-methyltransferase
MVKRNKVLGKYYTPRELAQTLVGWAITRREANFLDPSFGGCSFLYAAIDRLQDLGTQRPGRFVFGVDLDESARNYIQPLLMAGASDSHFLTTDFLGLSPHDMPGAPFQAICGNPPFVRHHFISARKLHTAIEAMRRTGSEIPKISSYWAYFLMHSLQFLEKGGRMAMILPTSFLYSNYSRRIWVHLRDKFGSVTIILLNGLVFDGVQEAPVLLLADRFLSPHRSMKMAVASSNQSVRKLSDKRNIQFSELSVKSAPKEWIRTLVARDALRLYEELTSDARVLKLGDRADIRIGVVTGCNEFFVLSEAERRRVGLSFRFLRRAVTRGQYVKGLQFTRRDYLEVLRANGPSYLLYAPATSDPLPQNISRYIKLGKKKGVDQGYHCSLRGKWFSLVDSLEADAFLNYMSSSVPHLVLNKAKVTCTNAIHRLRFSEKTEAEQAQCIAIACMCSLAQLSIEMVGRSYGGGVLKLEPSEAKGILLAVPPPSSRTSAAFRKIDSELRRGKRDVAVRLADKIVLEDFLQLDILDVRTLYNSWKSLADLRLQRAQSHPGILPESFLRVNT